MTALTSASLLSPFVRCCQRIDSSALHPESVSDIVVLVDGEAVLEWSGAGGTTEWQDVSIIDGYAGYDVTVQGVLQTGDFFGILEVRRMTASSELETNVCCAPVRAVNHLSRRWPEPTNLSY